MYTQPYQRGFTLLEVMITLTVLAIVAVLAVPAFDGYIANQRVKSAAYDLFNSLNYARSEAIKRNDDVFVKANGNWHSGWFVTTDNSQTYSNCTVASSNCLKRQDPAAGVEIDVSPSTLTLTYDNRGRLSGGQTTFSLCDPDDSAKVRKRQVQIDPSGRPTLQQNGLCNE